MLWEFCIVLIYTSVSTLVFNVSAKNSEDKMMVKLTFHCNLIFLGEKLLSVVQYCEWIKNKDVIVQPTSLSRVCKVQLFLLRRRHVDPSGVSWWNMQRLLVCLLLLTRYRTRARVVTCRETQFIQSDVSSSADSDQSASVHKFIITGLNSPPWGVRSWPCTPWAPVQCWSPLHFLSLAGFQSWY